MNKDAKLINGYTAHISEDGMMLDVCEPTGKKLFQLKPPPNSIFYLFQPHITYGVCPVIGFDPDHKMNGCTDWYYLIDIENQSLTPLNPWR